MKHNEFSLLGYHFIVFCFRSLTQTDIGLSLLDLTLSFFFLFCLASATVGDSFEEDFTTLMTHLPRTDIKWSINKVNMD